MGMETATGLPLTCIAGSRKWKPNPGISNLGECGITTMALLTPEEFSNRIRTPIDGVNTVYTGTYSKFFPFLCGNVDGSQLVRYDWAPNGTASFYARSREQRDFWH